MTNTREENAAEMARAESAPKFTESFGDGGGYVCAGDTITLEVEGFTLTARIECDHDSNIDDDDSHNIDQEVTGCDDDQQATLIAAREAWDNDEWFYCGVVVAVSKAGIELDTHASVRCPVTVALPVTTRSVVHPS